uniref:Immunoglobulin V-set domain-containing protein n=1 Tax=Sphenodon punctatus TaxID=8508 RepID=A0A8D0GSP9_SPHPU
MKPSFPVWTWIFFSGCWALSGPPEVSSIQGTSLSVPCQYVEGRQRSHKYWCRGDNWFSCSILVQTTGSEMEVKAGRISIQDNHTLHTFTVTMGSLRSDDEDIYWCGITEPGLDPMIHVNVTILPETTTFATSTWTLPKVAESSSSSNRSSSTAAGSMPFLLLYILAPSVLLVLLLIGILTVWYRRRNRALANRAQQGGKTFHLYKLSPGDALSSGSSEPPSVYMNMPRPPRPVTPEAGDYENQPSDPRPEVDYENSCPLNRASKGKEDVYAVSKKPHPRLVKPSSSNSQRSSIDPPHRHAKHKRKSTG